MLSPRRRRLLLELLEERAAPAAMFDGDGALIGSVGNERLFGDDWRSDGGERGQNEYVIPLNEAAQRRSAPKYSPETIDQALEHTCSFLSALSSLARTRPDAESRIDCDRAADPPPVPLFVDDHRVDVPLRMNGSAALAGDAASPHQSTSENWRYPAIALTPLTDQPSTFDSRLTDSDKELLVDALHYNRDAPRSVGFVLQTYPVMAA